MLFFSYKNQTAKIKYCIKTHIAITSTSTKLNPFTADPVKAEPFKQQQFGTSGVEGVNQHLWIIVIKVNIMELPSLHSKSDDKK